MNGTIYKLHFEIVSRSIPFAICLKPINSVHKIPNYFFDGKRNFSVIHERLRNFSSNLNQDLFDNHLRIDPSCSCLKGVETAEHSFLNVNIIQIKESACSETRVSFKYTFTRGD